jgi:hypothetical protein
MPEFEVRGPTKRGRLPEAWWAQVTIVEGDREETLHVLVPDRAQGEPTAEWIEAALRDEADDDRRPAIDQLADGLKPYYGMRHPVIRLRFDDHK